MSWQIEVNDEFTTGTLNDLVERAVSLYDGHGPIDEGALDKAVIYAIDDGMIYNADMLAAIQHYGQTRKAFVELVYELLWNDVYEYAYDEIENAND